MKENCSGLKNHWKEKFPITMQKIEGFQVSFNERLEDELYSKLQTQDLEYKSGQLFWTTFLIKD